MKQVCVVANVKSKIGEYKKKIQKEETGKFYKCETRNLTNTTEEYFTNTKQENMKILCEVGWE